MAIRVPPAFRWGSHPRARSVDGLVNLLAELKRSGLKGETPLGPVEVAVEKDGTLRVIVREVSKGEDGVVSTG